MCAFRNKEIEEECYRSWVLERKISDWLHLEVRLRKRDVFEKCYSSGRVIPGQRVKVNGERSSESGWPKRHVYQIQILCLLLIKNVTESGREENDGQR